MLGLISQFVAPSRGTGHKGQQLDTMAMRIFVLCLCELNAIFIYFQFDMTEILEIMLLEVKLQK